MTTSKRNCFTGTAGVALLVLACSSLSATAGKVPAGFTEHTADMNGVRLHYFIGGKGSPVVLLHGYAQTSHMWNPGMPLLAKTHTVIVTDLRGAGDSSKPESGYDKKNMAVDIHDLVKSLGFNRASVVGHDIGLMVAYAYAAQFPQETDRLVLMDACDAPLDACACAGRRKVRRRISRRASQAGCVERAGENYFRFGTLVDG